MGRAVTEFNTCSIALSCPTLCDSVDCSPPGSSVHGIFQARILEWAVISYSRDQLSVSCIIGREKGLVVCIHKILSIILYTPRSGLARSYDNSMFNYLRNHHSVSYSGFAMSHSSKGHSFQFLHILTNTYFLDFCLE